MDKDWHIQKFVITRYAPFILGTRKVSCAAQKLVAKHIACFSHAMQIYHSLLLFSPQKHVQDEALTLSSPHGVEKGERFHVQIL